MPLRVISMRDTDYLLALIPLFFNSTVQALPREIPEREVPAPVLQRFRSTYPGATNIHFKDEHISPPRRDYVVTFELNGELKKTEYLYDGLGVVEDRED
jgi:hypothetical protein